MHSHLSWTNTGQYPTGQVFKKQSSPDWRHITLSEGGEAGAVVLLNSVDGKTSMHLHLFVIQRAILDTHKSSLQSLAVEHSSGTDLASDENGIPGYMHVYCFVSTTTSKHEGYQIGESRN